MATNIAVPIANGASADSAHLLLEDRVWLLRAMLLMRGLEERAMTLYRQGKVPGSFYDGYGQEAVSAGAAFAMGPEDRLCILHRDLAAHLIRGVPAARGSSASTWAATRASPAAATATSTSAIATSAASGWSRCCPT